MSNKLKLSSIEQTDITFLPKKGWTLQWVTLVKLHCIMNLGFFNSVIGKQRTYPLYIPTNTEEFHWVMEWTKGCSSKLVVIPNLCKMSRTYNFFKGSYFSISQRIRVESKPPEIQICLSLKFLFWETRNSTELQMFTCCCSRRNAHYKYLPFCSVE